jgi:hypothetical protein
MRTIKYVVLRNFFKQLKIQKLFDIVSNNDVPKDIRKIVKKKSKFKKSLGQFADRLSHQ